MTDDLIPLNTGIAMAGDPDPERAKLKAREEADVTRWMQSIEQARKFDEPAREQYAKDRRLARGDSGFEVDANIVGTNIDILESFLYARDPDFDVTPGPSVRPPSIDSLRDAIEEQMQASPEVMQAGQMAAAAAVAMGTPPQMALQIGQQAQAAKVEELIRAEVDRMRKQFMRRSREIKGFAETCEIVGARMWKDAQLKRRGRPWVRSGLTIGLGVIKASWQERTAPCPETVAAINDLQANIKRLQSLRKELAEGGLIERVTGAVKSFTGSDDAKIADYERQIAALNGQVERVVARGFVVDNVAGEDFQVAPGYTIANHLDAPWNAHRIFMRYDDAKAEFALDDEKIRAAKRYRARKPQMIKNESVLIDDKVSAGEADAYVGSMDASGADGTETDGSTSGDFVALWEIWDRDSNTVLTAVEGVKCWVKEAWTPPATTRFYPFFLFCTSEVDGQRHPQSLVTRTAKLTDEYYRIGSAEAEHRRRIRPKTAFNAGLLAAGEAEKLERATTQEMVGINPTVPNTPIGNILWQVTYAQLDPALYDRTRIIQEIERVWGVQEALSGSINVAKTATEAEIQQSGFQARTGGRRDALESALGELALYTVEIARAFVDDEDVRAIAGPDAFWPPYTGPDDLTKLVNVDIRAGSSGKPNTSREREAWASQLPLLQQGIMQIGQLRGATPQAIADSLEQLLRITAERAGDRIDIDQLIPQSDTGVAQMPGMPGMPGMPMPGGPAPGGMPPTEPQPGGDPSADPLAA